MDIDEEIRSHSSKLTNYRLFVITARIDEENSRAWRNPCLPNVVDYFSDLLTFFNNTYMLYNEEELRLLKRLWKGFFTLYNRIRRSEKASVTHIEILIRILDNINRLMKGYLQKMQYWFKIGPKPVKGVEKAIEIIVEGGGLFGETEGISRVSGKSDESE